ncbi:hypothetical protein XENOCAPTIV_030132, partial [Xenoophorus captivus]
KPDSPTDLELTDQMERSVQLTWIPGDENNRFQSNGPGLEYKVQWRQKDVEDDWTSKNVVNVSQLIVSGTPTYVPYEIKVQAFNDYGNGPEPAVVIGFSGEDRK